MGAASAGTYPIPPTRDTSVTSTGRYSVVADSMRALARREPTLALHVHVGSRSRRRRAADERAARCAPAAARTVGELSLQEGRDSGFASSRTVIFQGFPGTGTPRCYTNYAEYRRGGRDDRVRRPPGSHVPVVGRAAAAVHSARSRSGRWTRRRADSAGLTALVHALARMVLEGDPPTREIGPEVLAENRFLAARDGLQARQIDPVGRRLVPICRADRVAGRSMPLLLRRDRSGGALERVNRLLVANGADRQRGWVRERIARAPLDVVPAIRSVAGALGHVRPAGSPVTEAASASAAARETG